LVRFIWTPEKEIAHATSKVWFEYGQIDRSRTTTISNNFIINGVPYPINATVRGDLNTKQFEMGYAPRWGNDKFRIGPSITYERLDVSMMVANLTPGAPPPTTTSLSVPNNVLLIGGDFDYIPNNKVDAYGHFGAVPCCGGGWHIFESEWGLKYYFSGHVGIIGGFRYQYMKRDFNVPATVVGTSTVGPFSGNFKFPGIGPYIGLNCRF